MKCRQAKNLLSPYMDGELHGKQKAALEEHLASCEACRAELEELKAISDTIRDIFRRIEPPPDLLEKTMRRIREMEESGEMERLRRRERLAKWRKAAMGVGLAAGIGLAALQIGRVGADVGPAAWPGGDRMAAPGAAVVAENAGGAPGQEEPGAEKPGDRGGGEAGAVKEGAPAPEERETRPPDVRVATEAKGTADKAPRQQPREPAGTGAGQPGREPAQAEAQVAAAVGGGEQQRAFLSRSRHVRTTMVKVEVADLASAKAAVTAAALRAGAGMPRELWVYQEEEVILRAVVPVGAAGRFLGEMAALGREVDRSRDTVNVTAEFDRRLLEYRELAAKKDRESQVLAKAIERQLEDLDRETLEAGREVVNVWLALR